LPIKLQNFPYTCVFSADTYFPWAVDVRKKKMENLDYFENFKKQNSFSLSFNTSWFVFKTLSKDQEGFRDDFQAQKAAFSVHSIKEF